MDALGDDYIVQHIVNEYKRKQEEFIYKTYVTDALMAISSRDSKMSKRFIDIVNNMYIKEETRTAEQIINSISDKLAKLEKERRE